ncbi:MAG: nucleotide exchange factor GrpE [Desulfobacterales bacterium]|jgi:molecular chaperone GrpE|nr:nucleotide exchange factor GrpE [Desulfobacterales bacterium]
MSEKHQRNGETEIDDADRNEDALEKPTGNDAVSASLEEQVCALEAKLAGKEKECRETLDKLLRVSAEFENYKKRAAREADEFRKYANQSLLKEMLSAIDHIELAIQAAAANGVPGANIGEGLHLTLKELVRIFEKFDVRPIAAAGQPFNPEYHEAMLREETETAPENTVVRELQKGYMIGKRLLRPALVVVSAAPASAQ